VAGPCVIEGEEHALESARYLKKLCKEAGVNFVYKSSYDKANRSSFASFRGPGLIEGLRILARVRAEVDVAVVTDVHSPEEATAAGKVVDIIQIPAFLCRQTDLINAAAETGKVVQVKKGQFMAPWDMKNVVDKIEACGNRQIILVDRGVSFGYNNLVSDMRAIPIMQALGYPVCFDATHSVQLPGGQGTSSGGQREFILPLARAALATGADMLFIEAHGDPKSAKSDSASMLSFDELKGALPKLKKLYDLIQS
ncbi:MAG: 3-deoxy-8-phosphooctulonate synthase, partial [Chlamydiia bacterium]|nr:3-deoxy-8-phosphooctulonate synthase [Chlamydiia bacterium]